MKNIFLYILNIFCNQLEHWKIIFIESEKVRSDEWVFSKAIWSSVFHKATEST